MSQKIISKKEARTLRLKYYFTGNLCLRGHVSERYVSDGSCVNCKAEDSLKENIKAYRSRYQQENAEYLKNYKAKRFQKNRERLVQQMREYYAKNREKVKKKQREYRESDPARVAEKNRNTRAARKNAKGKHTKKDVVELLNIQGNKCRVCSIFVVFGYRVLEEEHRAPAHVDHIKPLTRGGSNNVDNLQILCKKCNLTKNAKLMHEWLGPNYEERIANGDFHYTKSKLRCEAVTHNPPNKDKP